MLTDLHTHILPQLDDGSRSIDESLDMLRRSAEQGVTQIVLTPHFYPDHMTPEHFLRKRAASFALLQNHLEPGLPRLRLGAEVHYYPQMSYSEELRAMAIEGTDCLLVEMPMSKWTAQMYRELERIQANLGLTPIIAHVDRYLGRFRDYGIPKRLAELPVYVQANAEFFLDRRTAPKALSMLKKGRIHFLGSDCHNMTDRPPVLGDAAALIRRRLGDDAIERIRSNEREILL